MPFNIWYRSHPKTSACRFYIPGGRPRGPLSSKKEKRMHELWRGTKLLHFPKSELFRNHGTNMDQRHGTNILLASKACKSSKKRATIDRNYGNQPPKGLKPWFLNIFWSFWIYWCREGSILDEHGLKNTYCSCRPPPAGIRSFSGHLKSRNLVFLDVGPFGT